VIRGLRLQCMQHAAHCELFERGAGFPSSRDKALCGLTAPANIRKSLNLGSLHPVACVRSKVRVFSMHNCKCRYTP
jgi:hypothetical protein